MVDDRREATASRPGARIAIDPASAEQVVLRSAGAVVHGELRGAKGRLLTLTTDTFLPKNCRVRIELARAVEPVRVTGTVRKVQMVRTAPTYRVSVRVTDGDEAGLAVVAGELAVAPEEPIDLDGGGPDLGPIPRWAGRLVADGLTTWERVEEVEAERRTAGVTLERALVDAGVVPDEAVRRSLALDRAFSYVDLEDFDVRLENAALVPAELARESRVFPLFAIDGVITLAMQDPTDLALIDKVRLRSNCQVDPCMCAPAAIDELLDRAHRRQGKASPAQDFAPSAVPATPRAAGGEPDAQTTVRFVHDLVEDAARDGASDVHVEPERDELRIRMRVDGILHERTTLRIGQHAAIVSRLKVLAKLDITETRRPQDGQFSLRSALGDVDVRVSTLPTVWGEAVVLRLLVSDGSPLGLAQLGMGAGALAEFEQCLDEPHGMILVTGPTGSGKTTTLYAALDRLSTPERNVVTIEDPVEKRVPMLRQVSVNAAAGVTFASGLRSVLRQDPDVIMVGEIRDRETAEIATQAALTGHLVLSTLHTNTAAAALVRLVEIGIPPFLVNASLRAVVAQRLTRRICRHCRREVEPDPELLTGLLVDRDQHRTFHAGAGCSRCLQTGYKGRVGIYEMLRTSAGIQDALVAGADRGRIEVEAARAMASSMREDGLRQVSAGLTTLEEVARVVGVVPACSLDAAEGG